VNAFAESLNNAAGKRMLLELFAYCHALPETLQLGANHIVNHMQVQATKEERARGREPRKDAKGRVNG